MDFSDIIGHKRVIDNLQKAIKKGTVNHSYIFEGPDSTGKTLVAEVFAKTLLCKEKMSFPCNQCSSCIKFDSHNHPDFYIETSTGNSIKKEQIEELQKTIRIFPYESEKKVYVIKDAHKMTKDAQNCFLKTLEEPPSYAIIILTVNNSYSILPTVLSRCQVIRFRPVENKLIEDILVKRYGQTQEKAKFISSFSNGVVGKAINLSQSERFNDIRNNVIDIIDCILKDNDKYRALSFVDFFEKEKDSIDDILDIISVWFRDILVMKETNNSKIITNIDKLDIIKKQANKLSKNKINDIIDIVEKTKDDIKLNVNYQLSLEVMLLKIQEV